MNEFASHEPDRMMNVPAESDLLLDLGNDVSLKALAVVPFKRKRTIFTCALVGLLAAILIAAVMTPRYRATATIELNQDGQGEVIGLDDPGPAAAGGADEFKVKMQTEIAIIQDDSIAWAVLSKLGMLRAGNSGFSESSAVHVANGNAPTPKQRERIIRAFKRHLEVEEVKSSRLIAITYTSRDPAQAANVANEVAAEYKAFLLRSNFGSATEISQWLAEQLSVQSDRVIQSERAVADFERNRKPQTVVTGESNDDNLRLEGLKQQARASHELYDNLYARLQKEKINSDSSATNVMIVDPALLPGTPWMPRPLLFSAAGLGAGLLFGLGLAFLLESQDNSLAGTFQAEALTGVPVLGLIPFHKTEKKYQSAGAPAGETNPLLIDPKSATAMSVRNLRSSLLLMGAGTKLKTLSIVSALPEEGRSYTVYNLGLALAATGRKVLLIDADFHRPRLHTFFKAGRLNGFTDILAGRVCFDDVLLKHPVEANLSLLPAGQPSTIGTEMLRSDNVAGVLAAARDRFDIVLVDNAPTLLAADAIAVSAHCDGVIGVLRAGRTLQKALLRFIQILDRNQVRLLGTVIEAADMSPFESRWIYGYDVQSYYGEN